MHKYAILIIIWISTVLMGDAFGAAARATARGNARGGTSGASAQNAATPKSSGTTSARAAARTGAAAAPKTTTAAKTGGTTSARAAVRGGTTAAKTSGAKTTGAPVVSARAAQTQKVVGSGTKVAAAAQNIVVNEECRAKFEGCMDSFCMLDNDTGGRCLCNKKIFELDKLYDEIQKKDADSYKMATAGVERIEMGEDAAVLDNKISSLFETNDTIDEDIEITQIDKGPKVFNDAFNLCTGQIPECKSDFNVLKMLYSRQISSDCVAYENELKKMQAESLTKLNAARSALQKAALTELQESNKYDLGQCTIEFKKCMQTTAGCGNDFSSCAVMAALDATNTRKSTSKGAKNYQIQGAATTIEISASTYDMLMSKKPLCESVTKSCTKVANQVWDTFLKEVAPQLKSAELIAEDNERQNCISNISNCFQKGCKDNIDPNDPDGSYNMCLTRPGTMLNVCRVQMEKCGVDATNIDTASESKIWDFVVARLAAMRVDACTREVRECLTDQNRCGPDYSQCIGLDTDTIIRMCPYDKLTGCQQVYQGREILGESVYDELSTMVSGIMVNIDSRALEHCQNALNNSMINVCGNLENCNSLIIDKYASGTKSLEYKICEYIYVPDQEFAINFDVCLTDVSQISDTDLGRVEGAKNNELGPIRPLLGVMDGAIYWNEINADANGNITTSDEYFKIVGTDGISAKSVDRIRHEIDTLQTNIDSVISAIESDPTVQYCMTGRDVPGFKKFTDGDVVPRFPNLSQQTRLLIANAALDATRKNYYKHYDENQNRMMADYVTMAERQAEIRGANGRDARREVARQSCVALAEQSSLPKSPPPPKNMAGMIIVGAIVVIAVVVASIFTFGAAGVAAGAAAGATAAASAAASATAAAATATATATAAAATATAAAATATIGTIGTAITAVPLSAAVLSTTVSAAVATASATAAAAAAAAAATSAAVAIGVGAAGAAAALGTGIAAGVTTRNDAAHTEGVALELHGEFKLEQFNYRETVTTDFEWDTLKCHKCYVTQTCEKVADPWFGQKHCKKWGDESEPECHDIQF